MSLGVSKCQYVLVLVRHFAKCQYVSVVSHSVTQSSSDSVIQWLSHPVTQSFSDHFLLPRCLIVFDLQVLIQSQSILTSAFWLKSSVMFNFCFSVCMRQDKKWDLQLFESVGVSTCQYVSVCVSKCQAGRFSGGLRNIHIFRWEGERWVSFVEV